MTQEFIMTNPKIKPPSINSAQDSGDASLTMAASAPVIASPPEQLIRERAYELHLERGEAQSDALENWLRAEVELREAHVGT
jgi:DUF2934 family protein